MCVNVVFVVTIIPFLLSFSRARAFVDKPQANTGGQWRMYGQHHPDLNHTGRIRPRDP